MKNQANEDLDNAIEALKSGGIIGLPTDTVYGIAADAYQPQAVEKISQFKNRPHEKNYILQVFSLDQIWNLVDPIHRSPHTVQLLNKYWPGAMTFIFNKHNDLNLPYLGETVGLRIPNLPVTLDLLKRFGQPLAVTSLNRSGEPPLLRFDDIPVDIGRQLDFIIPYNESLLNIPSTIVDMTKDHPVVIRQGSAVFSLL